VASAVAFALLSLVFAGVNDVVFKKYASAPGPRGIFVLGTGVVWTSLQVALFSVTGTPLVFSRVTLLVGLLAGAILVISNILLIKSLACVDISLASTVYRLNTIAVVVLSVLFLGEPVGTLKSLGILCGVAAAMILYQRPAAPGHHARPFWVYFWATVAASLLRAGYGVTVKLGILMKAEPNAMLVLISATWVLGGAVYVIFQAQPRRLSRKAMSYSLLSGISVFLIIYFLMLAIERGQASTVIPIANLSFLVAILLSVIVKLEPLSTRKCFAAVLAAGAIALLSRA